MVNGANIPDKMKCCMTRILTRAKFTGCVTCSQTNLVKQRPNSFTEQGYKNHLATVHDTEAPRNMFPHLFNPGNALQNRLSLALGDP